jgi:hypothetical protein
VTNLELFFNYPFQGRNFFKEPETYFYSDCSSSTYVDDYMEYRQAKIHELSLSTQNNNINECFFTNTCKTNVLLRKILRNIQDGDISKLDRFCVKFETRKKFYSNYDQITLKPKAEGTDASFSAYVTFSECLCTAFEITKNLKYLSTLLKVNDAICSLKIPFDFAKRVQRLLELEMKYVEQL